VTPARSLIATLSIAAAVTVLAAQEPPPQTFRAGTDVVMVDVSVRDGKLVVTGLSAADFVLTDNGVRQQIESVEATSVPLDVTLAVDVSGNPGMAWRTAAKASEVNAALQREVNQVASLLRPADRLRLLTIDRYVRQVWPFLPANALPPVRGLEMDGLASTHDALAAALLHPVGPARRHVVIARTKGVDTISAVGAEALRAIAERSDARFHLVLMEEALTNDGQARAWQCANLGQCWPTVRSWIPHRTGLIDDSEFHRVTRYGLLVKGGVEATGGAWHQASGLSVPSLTGTFKTTFEDFRSSYMLRYTPQGVPRGGWHTISVTVPGRRSAEVNARRGYGVEEELPAIPTPLPAPNARLRTLPELTAAFERGAVAQVQDSLRRHVAPLLLLKDFEEEGNPWPGSPRLEAAFALVLVEPLVFSTRSADRTAAQLFLERYWTLVKQPLDPDDFEAEWMYAALTMLQGIIRPAAVEPFIERALAQFPKDPRFLLLRAINSEQRSLPGTRLTVYEAPGAPPPAIADIVRQHYQEAMAFPSVTAEARIRLAWMLYRSGQHDQALSQLMEAGSAPVPDSELRYLQQLFLGHVLAAKGEHEQSIAAYRAAAAILPGAQSPRVGLMNTLLMRGERAEAEALAEFIQTTRNLSQDPWWSYWQGQYRRHPQALLRLLEMAK
jgi:VWFA-related protein